MSVNFLEGTRCYLIGSMQYAKGGQGRSWRELVKSTLLPREVTCFDPYSKPFIKSIQEDEKSFTELQDKINAGKFAEVREEMKEIRSVDLSMVDRSDFIIAYIHPTVPSWGTPEELSQAVRLKKPIFLVVEGGIHKCPFWIFGMLHYKYMYNSIEDALKVICNIDDGILSPDSGRWRFLQKKYR